MKVPESLYIHIPYCISKCSYCDFFSKACGKAEIPDAYVSALCNEIEYRLQLYSVQELKTIYIGGGTPSLLSAVQLNKIFSAIKKYVHLQSDCEITMEVNPDDVTEPYLNGLHSAGITRLSCGIQSLNNESLKFCGRRASLEQNLHALEFFKNCWQGQVSVDLICGLPEETEQTFSAGLEKIISFSPDHISMYSLTVEEETPLGKMVESGTVQIDVEFQDDLWLKGRQLLELNGYKHYEVSNFAREGKMCRHNLVYWKHEGYIGAGSGGCGTVYNEDGTGLRWTNITDLEKYIQIWSSQPFDYTEGQIEESVDLDTSKFEFFMMGFRKLSGITDLEYKECFSAELSDHHLEVFKRYNQNGLLEIETEKNKTRYRLNKKGILLLNRFLEDLL